jgi:hypothetical protein
MLDMRFRTVLKRKGMVEGRLCGRLYAAVVREGPGG